MAHTLFWFLQDVTYEEMNDAFARAHTAIDQLKIDVGMTGVALGLDVVESDPPALTVEVSEGVAYDGTTGQRIPYGGGNVDVSVDFTGLNTEPTVGGNERWISVFVRYVELFEEEHIDGNGATVYRLHNDSSEIVIRMGAEDTIGLAVRHPLVSGEILLADINRIAGQSTIVDANVDYARRQRLEVFPASSITVDPSGWAELSPAVNNVQSSLDEVDEHLAGGTKYQHADDDITADDASWTELAGATVDEVFDTLDARLVTHFTGADEHLAENVDVAAGGWSELAADNVQEVGDALDGHFTDSTAHTAAEVVVTPVAGTAYAITAIEAQAALAELLSSINQQHDGLFAVDHVGWGESGEDGQHDLIHHDPVATAQTGINAWALSELIVPSTGGETLRMYYSTADSKLISPHGWIAAYNARRIGTPTDAWQADDDSAPSWAIAVNDEELALWWHPPTVGTWTNWLTLGGKTSIDMARTSPYTPISTAWATQGGGREYGVMGLTAYRQFGTGVVDVSSSVNFKGYFEGALGATRPTSVGIQGTIGGPGLPFNWATPPTTANVVNEGFRLQGTSNSLTTNAQAIWHGRYVAIY